jgi:hypothetical protein
MIASIACMFEILIKLLDSVLTLVHQFREMERDCMLANEVNVNLLERLFYLSNFFGMHMCGQCRMHAIVVLRDGARGPYCPFCRNC